jgi:hypothetical protein
MDYINQVAGAEDRNQASIISAKDFVEITAENYQLMVAMEGSYGCDGGFVRVP